MDSQTSFRVSKKSLQSKILNGQEDDQFFPKYLDNSPLSIVVKNRYKNRFQFTQLIYELVTPVMAEFNHSVYSFLVFGDLICIPHAKYEHTDADSGKTRSKYVMINNGDCKGIIEFQQIQYVAGEANYFTSIYNWLKYNNIPLFLDFVNSDSDLALIQLGQIQNAFGGLPDFTFAAGQDFGKKCNYERIMNIAKRYMGESNIQSNYDDQLEQLYGQVGQKDSQYSNPISSYDGQFQSIYDPNTEGFQVTIGWKSVQFNNVFYNIPQLTNLEIVKTNQLWLMYPQWKGWIIILTANLVPFNSNLPYTNNSEVADFYSLRKILIVLNAQGKIQYLPNIPKEIADKGFADMYSPTEGMTTINDTVERSLAQSIYMIGIDIKKMGWIDVPEPMKKYLMGIIKFNQYEAEMIQWVKQNEPNFYQRILNMYRGGNQ